MIGRRAVLASGLVSGGALLLPVTSFAQEAGVRRVGILMPYRRGDRTVEARVAGFREMMRRLGWGSVRPIVIDEAWVGDDLDAIRTAVADLRQRGVEVVLTTGSRVVPIVQSTAPAMSIVFVGTSDPVGQGLVESLARPGGTTTGFSLLEFVDGESPLLGKLVEFARQLVPELKRIGLLFNPDNPATAFYRRSVLDMGPKLSLSAVLLPVNSSSQIAAALRDFADGGGGVLVLPSDLTLLSHREAIVKGAAQHRLPTIYSDPAFVRDGGLMSYSADRNEMFKQSAGYVDRILKGERAGELPIQQPTRYELVVNFQAAKALGIELPPSILIRADEVVE